MSYQYDMLEIQKKLLKIDQQLKLNSVASNVVINHLLRIISNKFPDDDIRQELKKSIEADLSRVNIAGQSDIKRAINEILQSPIRDAFGPKEDPLIK